MSFPHTNQIMAKRPTKRVEFTIEEPQTTATAKGKKAPAFKIEPERNSMHQLFDYLHTEQFRLISGVVIGIFTLLLIIAYISFIFTGTADFSIMQLDHAARRAERMNIQNALGLPGAALVYFFVNQTFGIASVAILVWLAGATTKLLLRKPEHFIKFTICNLFALLYGSLFFGFIDLIIGQPIFFRLGGHFGEITGNWAMSYIKVIGYGAILIVVLFIFLTLVNNNFIPWLKRSVKWCINRIKKQRTDDVSPTPTEQGSEPSIVTDQPQQTEQTEEITTVKPTQEQQHSDDTPKLKIEIEQPEQTDPVEQQTDTTEPKNDTDTELQTEQNDEQPISIEAGEAVELKEDSPEYLLQKLGPYDPRKDLEFYKLPEQDLLKVYPNETVPIIDREEREKMGQRIIETLSNYGVDIDSIKATVGPTVTLYEVVPKAGVKISRIQSLEADIMMSLSAKGIRIIAPIPGKGTVGIEVPNEKPQVVSMHSVIASAKFQEEKKMRLPIAIGRTITNDVFMFDLAKTPHLLVAGATGQGKSVAINAIITSLLYKKHPSELKMVLVDPKMVEFAPYKPLIKHYLAAMPDTDPNQVVITDCDNVINTLNSLVIEMENRYKLLMDAGVRNLEDYNEKFINRRLNPEKLIDGSLHHRYLPYIVIIIDEYGDFIMQAGKQVETPIARITQKARAVGMHMILATQRPSVNIVTGVIKANIPTRIALRTQSVIDSRTVLDAKGAEQLIGRGDMLYAGNSEIIRLQCAFVDTPEVDDIVNYISAQTGFFEPYQLPEYVAEGAEGDALAPGSVDMKRLDPMFADVARYVVNKQEGSTSRLQRAFEIGYNRAGKLSDQLEAAGIVGPNKGSKGRDVLIQDPNQLEQLLKDLGV